MPLMFEISLFLSRKHCICNCKCRMKIGTEQFLHTHASWLQSSDYWDFATTCYMNMNEAMWKEFAKNHALISRDIFQCSSSWANNFTDKCKFVNCAGLHSYPTHSALLYILMKSKIFAFVVFLVLQQCLI